MSKLNWTVAKTEDGKFARRKLSGDVMFDLDYIDVEWTHVDGFPEDEHTIPLTHPPEIEYKTKGTGTTRTVIKDQVSVSPDTSDATVAIMLDEKRIKLAKSLNVEP